MKVLARAILYSIVAFCATFVSVMVIATAVTLGAYLESSRINEAIVPLLPSVVLAIITFVYTLLDGLGLLDRG